MEDGNQRAMKRKREDERGSEEEELDVRPVEITRPWKRLRRTYSLDLIPDEILVHLITNYLDVRSLIRLMIAYKRCYYMVLPKHFSKVLQIQTKRWKEGVRLMNKYGPDCLLFYGIQEGTRELVEYAIQKGADVNAQREEVSALEEAVLRDEYELFKLLLRYKARPDAGVLNAIAIREEGEEEDYRYSCCLGQSDYDLLDLARISKGRLEQPYYCQRCFKKIVPIGDRRANGANHRDWDARRYHKRCWANVKKEERAMRTHARRVGNSESKEQCVIDLTNE